MAGTLGDYAENLAVDTITNYGSDSRWLALFTTNPNFETGVGGVEPGGDYARMDVDFSQASGGVAANIADLEFEVGANLGAGTYYGWGVFTADTGGSLLFGDEFATPRVVSEAGETITFYAGDITINIT